jgi:hypothetical protein
MKLVVSIDRLVLDGLAATPREAARIRASMETELARLLSAEPPGRLRAGGAVPSLPAPALPATAARSPETLGAQIARSVHAGLGDAP